MACSFCCWVSWWCRAYPARSSFEALGGGAKCRRVLQRVLCRLPSPRGMRVPCGKRGLRGPCAHSAGCLLCQAAFLEEAADPCGERGGSRTMYMLITLMLGAPAYFLPTFFLSDLGELGASYLWFAGSGSATAYWPWDSTSSWNSPVAAGHSVRPPAVLRSRSFSLWPSSNGPLT